MFLCGHARTLINDPEHWRDRAREKRALAERLRNEQAKQTVLRVANEYERLAERTEERSRRLATSKTGTPGS
jgi:thymidylate kinase